MTNGNDLITTTTYRQIGDEDFRVATEKDLREGAYLSTKPGLSKREYFAAMAMQGYTSAGSTGMPQAYDLAVLSVNLADALILQLNKK